MSTYTVEIGLAPAGASAATHAWTVNSGDVPDPSDPTQVLDGLTMTWGVPEDEPWPAQPDIRRANLRLLLDDFDELADIRLGDACRIKVTSGGTVVAHMSGRIAQPTATLVRRKVAGVMVRKVLYTIPVVDYLADLASLLISGDWPAESALSRLAHVAAAVMAHPRCTELGLVFVDLATGIAPDTSFTFAAASISNQAASAVIEDTLKQIIWNRFGRRWLHADTSEGAGVETFGQWRAVATPGYVASGEVITPPGFLQLVAHELGVGVDGTAPAQAGLLLDSGRVDESDMSYTALRFTAVTSVTLVGSFGAVTATNGQRGRDVTITTDLTDAGEALLVARMYLSPADDVHWTMDSFTWRPTDAELAALDYPIVPATDTAYDTAAIYAAQVAIAPLDPVVNPGSAQAFYAGTLAGGTLSISRGGLTFVGQIARRLSTAPATCATVGDVVAHFPTVKLKVGVDVVDPDLTVYDVKLARKM